MIIDLVWLKLLRECLYAHAVCVCGRTCLHECVCVCECVFLAVSELFLLIFAFLYPRNLPPGHVTIPFLTSVTQ